MFQFSIFYEGQIKILNQLVLWLLSYVIYSVCNISAGSAVVMWLWIVVCVERSVYLCWMTMTTSAERKFVSLRKRLDQLGYRQPLAIESLPLVEKLFRWILSTVCSIILSTNKDFFSSEPVVQIYSFPAIHFFTISGTITIYFCQHICICVRFKKWHMLTLVNCWK